MLDEKNLLITKLAPLVKLASINQNFIHLPRFYLFTKLASTYQARAINQAYFYLPSLYPLYKSTLDFVKILLMNHTSTQPKHQLEIIDQVLTRGVESVLPNKKSLAELMMQKRIRIYLGIDPTGAFLHLGHAVVLRKLQQLAELGHEVILLIGNGTVKIGDPTGVDESRPMLTNEEIEQNWQNWKEQASAILDFNKIIIKRNGEWLDKLSYADIVKLLAKATVQQLLERDMFQERMKKKNQSLVMRLFIPYCKVMTVWSWM